MADKSKRKTAKVTGLLAITEAQKDTLVTALDYLSGNSTDSQEFNSMDIKHLTQVLTRLKKLKFEVEV